MRTHAVGDIPEKTDWSKAVRGRSYRPHAELKVSVYLEPDVAKDFRSSAAVNEALRSFLRISKTTRHQTRQRMNATPGIPCGHTAAERELKPLPAARPTGLIPNSQ